MLSDEAKAQIKEAMTRYPDARSAIMPALYIAQDDYGWLPQEAIDEVATLFGMTSTEVGSVASFYTMFFVHPVGRHVIDFCTDLPCALVGAEAAYDRFRQKLGIPAHEGTTADEMITLKPAMCLGGCHRAPVLLLDNQEQHENMTDEKLDALVKNLHARLHEVKL
jgi:NADH-quinone oxidoreductase subunit E